MPDITDDELDSKDRDGKRLRLVKGRDAEPGREAAGESRRGIEREAGRGSGVATSEAAVSQGTQDAKLQQDARDEQGREDSRRQMDVGRPDGEVADDRRVRHADNARGDLRAEAAGERRVGRADSGRAAELRDGAAGSDDPGADADRTKADRLEASADRQDRLANYDDAVADSYGAEAQEIEQAPIPTPTDGSQPPAREAVAKAPTRAPRARKNLKTSKTPTQQRSRD